MALTNQEITVKTAQLIRAGFLDIPVKVKNCLCPDGRRRTAQVKAPDTFDTMSARVKAYGKTVTGFVISFEQEGQPDYEFIPYLYRKNHSVFNQQEN